VRHTEQERGRGAVVKRHRLRRWQETKTSWTGKSVKKGKTTLERSIDVKHVLRIFSFS